MRKTILALAVSFVLASPFALAATPRSETQSYIAAGGDLTVSCAGVFNRDVNRGGACFTLDGTETTVTLTIDDAHAVSIGGYYSFTDSAFNGDELAGGYFCDRIENLAVPAGSAELFVLVDQAFNLIDCADIPGTVGTVTADFA